MFFEKHSSFADKLFFFFNSFGNYKGWGLDDVYVESPPYFDEYDKVKPVKRVSIKATECDHEKKEKNKKFLFGVTKVSDLDDICLE